MGAAAALVLFTSASGAPARDPQTGARRTAIRLGSRGSSKTCIDQKSSTPPRNGCPAAAPSPRSLPKGSLHFVPMPVPRQHFVQIRAGTITRNIQPPFSSEEYLMTNAWWNETRGRLYDVYAGALGSDQSQGIVVVFRRFVDDPTQTRPVSLEAFPTGRRDGELTISRAAGWILTLKAADGAVYRFDVKTSQYVVHATP